MIESIDSKSLLARKSLSIILKMSHYCFKQHTALKAKTRDIWHTKIKNRKVANPHIFYYIILAINSLHTHIIFQSVLCAILCSFLIKKHAPKKSIYFNFKILFRSIIIKSNWVFFTYKIKEMWKLSITTSRRQRWDLEITCQTHSKTKNLVLIIKDEFVNLKSPSMWRFCLINYFNQ